MKKSHKEFWVEFEFVETEWGRRANKIHGYYNKAEAEAFAETTTDGVVVEVVMTEC